MLFIFHPPLLLIILCDCYISGAKNAYVSSSQFDDFSVTTTSSTIEAGELQVNFKLSVILEVIYKELEKFLDGTNIW